MIYFKTARNYIFILKIYPLVNNKVLFNYQNQKIREIKMIGKFAFLLLVFIFLNPNAIVNVDGVNIDKEPLQCVKFRKLHLRDRIIWDRENQTCSQGEVIFFQNAV